MIKNFIKYQSLGNNFILFDWYDQLEESIQQTLHDASWPTFVKNICNRHTGVGADGVLILKRNEQEQLPEMLIFNADGTQAESCLNGLRCVTHYLVTKHGFPASFLIKLGKRTMVCGIEKSGTDILITNNIGNVEYQGTKTVTIFEGTFHGHVASVGNPHFIIFQKTELDWLQRHGAALESHEAFPHKTNVEFIWEDGVARYHVLVYERGCGITQACSSGAAAIVGTLFHLKKIEANQKIELVMLGGSVISWVDHDGNVFLQAGAQPVFTGVLEE